VWAVKNLNRVMPANGVDVGGRTEGEVCSISATLHPGGGGLSIGSSLAILERRMHSGWVVAGCCEPRNLVHAHPPAFLAGLLSWTAWNMYVTGTLSFNPTYFNVT
jgi:hypothetical protein